MTHEKNWFLFLVFHTKKAADPCCRLMDTELRKSLHIIIGTVKFTKLQGYPFWAISNFYIPTAEHYIYTEKYLKIVFRPTALAKYDVHRIRTV